MILPHATAERFFYIYDYLCAFAHERLGVVSDAELFTGEPPRGLSEEGQRLTMEELWENPQIIEAYVRENPDGLAFGDRALVRSWTNAYNTYAYVGRDASGKAWFFVDDYAIDLCGLTKEPASMLRVIPTVVRLTLLPLGERIIYDQRMLDLPVDLGPSASGAFATGLADALAEGRILRTGAELAAHVPDFKQRHLDAQMEQFRHEMEMEERSAGTLPGEHRGVLAGVHGRERDDAVMAHAHEVHPFDRVAHFDEQCLPGEPIFDLVELIDAANDAPSADDLAESFDALLAKYRANDEAPLAQIEQLEALKAELDGLRAENEALRAELGLTAGQTSLASTLSQQYLEPSTLLDELAYLTEEQIERVRTLAMEGGHQTFPADNEQLRDLKVPSPARGLCYLFRTDDTFHAVMPREVVPVARTLDWESARAETRLVKQIGNFADAVIDLRGMARIKDVVAEFSAAYTDGSRGTEDLIDELAFAIETDRSSALILDTGSELYLLHYILAWEYREGRGEDPYVGDFVIKGPLDSLLKGLLKQHEGKEPRPVPPEMMSPDLHSAFDWRYVQPPALALVDFLDEHIPDGADDYFYAEKVLEDVLEEQRWGTVGTSSVERYFDILDQNGLVVDESKMQKLLTLWQNLCNGLPCWPNNGWSPNELQNRLSRRRLFYNPDGSLMRIGRNDPCPCGSGKKYKRCCGRG